METDLCNKVSSKEKNQRENGTVNSSIQFSNGFQIEFPVINQQQCVIGLECVPSNNEVPLHYKEVNYGLKAHNVNDHLAPAFNVQSSGYGDSSEGSIDQFSQENRDINMLSSHGETNSHSQQHHLIDTQMMQSSVKPNENVTDVRFLPVVSIDLRGLKDDGRKTSAIHLQSGTSMSSDRPKKRKGDDLGLLPWHIEVSNGSCRLQSVGLAETEWASASKRLSEKIEDEPGTNHDVLLISRAKKRLKSTTQLLQQVIRPPPTNIFSGDARLNSESVLFFVCRSALGDACNLTKDHVTRDKPLKKFRTSGSISKQEDLLKTLENFSQRAKRLETDLLRLENLSSISVTKLEIQEQERFSTLTRLFKFHSRGNVVSGNAQSDSGTTRPLLKPNIERYVVAHPMPRIVPEETKCLSL